MSEPTWLVVGRELKAIAQIGLTFSEDAFDRQRYERIQELSAALIANGSDGDAAKVLDLFQREVGYATPKVDVRGAGFRDGRVLMVREVSDGGWTLPGGWARQSNRRRKRSPGNLGGIRIPGPCAEAGGRPRLPQA